MKPMARTQVFLETEVLEGLKRLAQEEQTSMGELIRRGARLVLRESGGFTAWGAADPLWELVGLAQGGPLEDASNKVDDYLYGPRETPRLRRVAEQRAPYQAGGEAP
ncbi:MAG: ribbon-helix-helix protein, CopG family [Chloroflexota bacterium]